MKVTKLLNVSSEQFFDLLNVSLIKEVKTNSKKNLDKANIKVGLRYSKTLKSSMGNSSVVNVELIEYVPLKKYVSKVSNAKSDYIIGYEIEESDKGVSVTYFEEPVFVKKIDRWNFNLVSFLYKNKTQRNMLIRLDAIEAEILKSVDGQECTCDEDKAETELIEGTDDAKADTVLSDSSEEPKK